MGFEMSLPHAPRIQAVAGDGTESLAADEQQWELYNTVQQALQVRVCRCAGGMSKQQQQRAQGWYLLCLDPAAVAL